MKANMTMLEVKRAAAEVGNYWFSAPTMRFFRSRVLPKIWNTPHGPAFISSEQFNDETPRCYSVRVVNFSPRFRVTDYPGTTFMQFKTVTAAKLFLGSVRI
jgi:hypothetical protein